MQQVDSERNIKISLACFQKKNPEVYRLALEKLEDIAKARPRISLAEARKTLRSSSASGREDEAELERLRGDLAAEKQRSRDLVQALAYTDLPASASYTVAATGLEDATAFAFVANGRAVPACAGSPASWTTPARGGARWLRAERGC